MKREGKHRTARSRRRLLKRRVTYLLAIIVASVLIGLVAYSLLNLNNPTVTPKIAVVDQLSVQWPDPQFDQAIVSILNQTGLEVDYYPSEEVTVDFYRSLPSQNYKLIIFRVHSTAETVAKDMPPWVVFFTSENYSSAAHVPEQSDMQVVYVKFPDSPQVYFGISPKFVQNSMEGRFNDTTIVAMGCEGLNHTTMAEAFIERGAKAFISFDGPVSETYTDNVTVYLLRHLVTEKQTIQEALKETMNEVGPDPEYKSVLTFYPDNAGADLLSDTRRTTPPVTAATEEQHEQRRPIAPLETISNSTVSPLIVH